MATTTGADPLEGISEKSTKAELMQALNTLADKVRSHERKRTGKLGEIEKRVHAKYKPGDIPELHNVVFSSTIEEVKETKAFLDEFDDVLPLALARLRQGLLILIEGPPTSEPDEDDS